MALANPAVSNGVTEAVFLAHFGQNGQHAGHAYSHLGILRDGNENRADVYYCINDNRIFILNG